MASDTDIKPINVNMGSLDWGVVLAIISMFSSIGSTLFTSMNVQFAANGIAKKKPKLVRNFEKLTTTLKQFEVALVNVRTSLENMDDLKLKENDTMDETPEWALTLMQESLESSFKPASTEYFKVLLEMGTFLERTHLHHKRPKLYRQVEEIKLRVLALEHALESFPSADN